MSTDQQTLERDNTFWLAFGFSLGLAGAAVAVYLLIRQRWQKNIEDNQQFQLSHNGHMNAVSTDNSPVVGQLHFARDNPSRFTQLHAAPVTTVAEPTVTEPITQATPPPTETPEPKHTIPADAVFMGLASTKRYYPVSTPLDQLQAQEEGPLDILYFSSEDEAKLQGFSRAEE